MTLEPLFDTAFSVLPADTFGYILLTVVNLPDGVTHVDFYIDTMVERVGANRSASYESLLDTGYYEAYAIMISKSEESDPIGPISFKITKCAHVYNHTNSMITIRTSSEYHVILPGRNIRLTLQKALSIEGSPPINIEAEDPVVIDSYRFPPQYTIHNQGPNGLEILKTDGSKIYIDGYEAVSVNRSDVPIESLAQLVRNRRVYIGR